MSKKISIAIDAMGGDNSPDKTIEGIKIFLDKNKSNGDFLLNIFGDSKKINEKIKKYNIDSDLINLIHSDKIVSDEETPMTAVKNSKNTSMWNCIHHQLEGKSDISLSAGNTGVLLVISRMILKMMNDVSKPALAGLWPSQNGMNVVLDLGANIECNDQNLIDFAELGSALFKSLFPTEKPKVSLLNVGSEEIKGTEMLKLASKRLKDLSSDENFSYKGYIEGNNLMTGESNVIVTDGFTGNIALKTAEGTAKFITTNLKKTLTENFLTKISLLFSYFSLKKFKDKLDPRKYNGAIFLGLNGPVVKSHGGIDSIGFYYSIDLCYKIIKGNLMDEIKKNLKHSNSA
ncbi:MAG: phosphate acyltransferase [Pelagibacterales bacterium MED-G43]|nr:MAG: phosphate acyltransferase [Pelagibacterales bacterium MED-G43]